MSITHMPWSPEASSSERTLFLALAGLGVLVVLGVLWFALHQRQGKKLAEREATKEQEARRHADQLAAEAVRLRAQDEAFARGEVASRQPSATPSDDGQGWRPLSTRAGEAGRTGSGGSTRGGSHGTAGGGATERPPATDRHAGV